MTCKLIAYSRSISTRAFALSLALLPMHARAVPSLTAVYSFAGGADGASPIAGLVADSIGTLYGTTPSGGGAGCGGTGCGTVFKLAPPVAGQTQWTETVIYSFSGGADGSMPMAGLTIGSGGVLYGTTSAGGLGFGTVFALTPPASGNVVWTESVLHAFEDTTTDGSVPLSSLLLGKDGSLYGTTLMGGVLPRGWGTVFRLSPPSGSQTAWTDTLLWKFLLGRTDGANPKNGVIMDASGNLYGTTSYNTKFNGTHRDCGTIYKLIPGQNPDGLWTETTLAYLQTVDLSLCQATGLLYMDSAGILYDTTLSAFAPGTLGTSGGGVLSLTPPAAGQTAWTQTNIDKIVPGSFLPYSGVIPDAAGNLYGTSAGYFMRGTTPIAGATIFELVRPTAGGTWTQKILARFDITNGALPNSPLLLAKDGTLYGTAQAGGAYGFGTVFALARPGK